MHNAARPDNADAGQADADTRSRARLIRRSAEGDYPASAAASAGSADGTPSCG